MTKRTAITSRFTLIEGIMASERIEAGKAPHIFIDACEGDLVVQGWVEPVLLVRGEFQVEETDKGFRLTGQSDLRLSVPVGATLSIAEVAGDAAVKHLNGPCALDVVHGDAILADLGRVEIKVIHGDLVARGVVEAVIVDEVHGDLSARTIGNLTLHAVFGDLSARRVNGPVVVKEASGDVDLRAVDGEVAIGSAHRDVNLAYINGHVAIAEAAGDVRLRGGLPAGEHSLQARGDVVLRWPTGAPLALSAKARRFDNRLPLEDVSESDGRLSGRIGSGDARLNVVADGRLILKEMDMVNEKWEGFGVEEGEFGFAGPLGGAAFENLGARIEAEINTHLSRVTRDFETRFGPEFGQRMAEKMARQSERAAERVERARRRADTGRRSGAGEAAPNAASRKVASPEEQMKILKMVETGTITPEEAGMLLEALEG